MLTGELNIFIPFSFVDNFFSVSFAALLLFYYSFYNVLTFLLPKEEHKELTAVAKTNSPQTKWVCGV